MRLGALGPMEDGAAKVLERKRFSFLVNAPRLYGAYAPVLTLFLFDTAFDDEVRELLGLLAKDKQLQQTVGQMRDVVRGLGRAVDDVRATIPGADGAGGTRVYGVRADLPPPYQEAFDETFRALTRERLAPGNAALGFFDHLTFGVPLGFYYLAVGTGHGVNTLTQGQYEQATRELAPAALMVGLYVGGKGVRYLSETKGAAGIGEGGVRLPVSELRVQVLKEVVERLRERLGEDGLGQLGQLIQGRREIAVMVAAGGEPVAMAIYEARGDLTRAQAVLSQAKPEPRGSTRPVAGAGESPGGAPLMVEEVTGPAGKHSTAEIPSDAAGHPEGLAQIGELASSIRWKGFSDGKLASHFNKHVLEAGEFGGKITQNQYLKMAKEFAQEKSKRFLEKAVGAAAVELARSLGGKP